MLPYFRGQIQSQRPVCSLHTKSLGLVPNRPQVSWPLQPWQPTWHSHCTQRSQTWQRHALVEDIKQGVKHAIDGATGPNPEDFNLPLACVMGACAFEAYNVPYQTHGIKQVDGDGAEVVYMDRDFLASIVKGVMQVHVRRAVDLPLRPRVPKEEEVPEDPKEKKKFEEETKKQQEKDKKLREHNLADSCDPLCQVIIGNSSGKTDSYPGSRDPTWRSTLFVYVQDPEQQSLKVRVLHDTKDDEVQQLLGEAELPSISEFCDGEQHEVELDLEGEGCSGRVFLSLKYEPHGSESTQDMLQKLGVQAVNQLLIDDWRDENFDDWDDSASGPWTSDGLVTSETPVAANSEENIDIKGGEAAVGVELSRDPWKMWQSLRQRMQDEAGAHHFTPLAFVTHEGQDIESWIYRNIDDREAIISFRGTMTPGHMLTDIDLDLAAFNPGGRRESRSPEEVSDEIPDEEILKGPLEPLMNMCKMLDKLPGMGTKKDVGRGETTVSRWMKAQAQMLYSSDHKDIWVHKGFLTAYANVASRVLSLMDEVLAEVPDEPWHIYVTGHSMGGSIGQLCAYELSCREYKRVKKPKISCYTFGQPRVGNVNFSEDYAEVVPDTWRIKNVFDLVPQVPSLIGYQHAGPEVQLRPEGLVSISAKSSDDVREGACLAELWPMIKEGTLGDNPEAKKEFDDLIKGELRISTSILKGTAVQHHMEDVYHDILKACVDRARPGFKPEFVPHDYEAIKEAEDEQKKNGKGDSSDNADQSGSNKDDKKH